MVTPSARVLPSIRLPLAVGDGGGSGTGHSGVAVVGAAPAVQPGDWRAIAFFLFLSPVWSHRAALSTSTLIHSVVADSISIPLLSLSPFPKRSTHSQSLSLSQLSLCSGHPSHQTSAPHTVCSFAHSRLNFGFGSGARWLQVNTHTPNRFASSLQVIQQMIIPTAGVSCQVLLLLLLSFGCCSDVVAISVVMVVMVADPVCLHTRSLAHSL